jgi:hypothetical protein
MFFGGYFEGIKSYRLLCIQTKEIIKNREVLFMEDNMNIGINVLRMWDMCNKNRHPSRVSINDA